MNVTLRQLRAFVGVAHRRSFTRAAEALSISQPAVTIAVGELEDRLGLKLLERSTRRVSLTSDGETFLRTAERLLADFDAAIDGMRSATHDRHESISLAVISSIAIRLLPPIIVRFNRSNPFVRIHVADTTASSVQRRVRYNEADFGIGSRWEADPDLEFTPLVRDPLGVVCRADHPLAHKSGPLEWHAIAGFPFLGLARDSGIGRLLSQNADRLPRSAQRPKLEFSNITILAGMLETGYGIAVLPALCVPSLTGSSFEFRRLTNPMIDREIHIIMRRNQSHSSAAWRLKAQIERSVPARWLDETQ